MDAKYANAGFTRPGRAGKNARSEYSSGKSGRIQACEVRPETLNEDLTCLAKRAKKLVRQLPDTYHIGALGHNTGPKKINFSVGIWYCQIIAADGNSADLELDISLNQHVTGTYTSRNDGYPWSLSGSASSYWNSNAGGILLKGFIGGLRPINVRIPVTGSRRVYLSKQPHDVRETFSWVKDDGFRFGVKLLRKNW